jgi:hypothetical protein
MAAYYFARQALVTDHGGPGDTTPLRLSAPTMADLL